MIDVLVWGRRNAREGRKPRFRTWDINPVRLICRRIGVDRPLRVEDGPLRCHLEFWWADGGARHLAVLQPPLVTVRAGCRKTRLNGIVADQVLVVRILTTEVGRISAYLGLSPLIDLTTDLVLELLVHNADDALKQRIDRPVIGKAQWRRVVRELPKVWPLAEDAIRPRWNPRLFPVLVSEIRFTDHDD